MIRFEASMANGLVWFYGQPTIVGYSIPNPVLYIYIKYKICKHS